jgi:phosphoserine phosphatase
VKIRRHSGSVRVTERKTLAQPNASGREWVEETVATFKGRNAENAARWYTHHACPVDGSPCWRDRECPHVKDGVRECVKYIAREGA